MTAVAGYVRIKNELARSLSVTQHRALDICAAEAYTLRFTRSDWARRASCERFVGCVGAQFNLPWYWTPARKLGKTLTCLAMRTIVCVRPASLAAFKI